MTPRLPPPTDWSDFEDLCRDLFQRIWNAPWTQKNGRQGQPQAGVDVFGMPNGGPDWAGVQCKLVEDRLTRAVLKKEVEKAEGFNPKLASYVIATTAKQDVKVQEWARELKKNAPFDFRVEAWEDLRKHVLEHPDLVEKYFPELVIEKPVPDLETDDAIATYLDGQWHRLLPLPAYAMSTGDPNAQILLTDVYTALRIRAEVVIDVDSVTEENPEGRVTHEDLPLDPDYRRTLFQALAAEILRKKKIRNVYDKEIRRPITGVEAVAGSRRFVLVGEAGSGKSTFAKHLALTFLRALRGEGSSNLDQLEQASELQGFVPWPFPTPVPFFVELREWVASRHFPKEQQRGQAKHLERMLVSLGGDSPSFRRWVRGKLGADGGALVLLDGLDETPASSEVRERIRQSIQGFVLAYPHCRIVVTSRPYAYEAESPWRLDGAGFASARLAPFDRDQQQSFVQGWYRRLVKLGQVKADRQKPLAEDLAQQIGATEYLSPLAERPLMLTMMADLHASRGGDLPGGRAPLYEASVDLLLDRWNQAREGNKATDLLGLPIRVVREALELLAYRVHRSGGVDGDRGARIDRKEVWAALDDARRANALKGAVDEAEIMKYLHQRSGILSGESSEYYRFPHRSYQEFLAASHLLRVDYPGRFGKVLDEDPLLWREVAQLLVGQVAELPLMAWAALETLVDADPPESEITSDDPRFLRTLFAGLAVRECGLWKRVEAKDRPKLERIRLWLRRIVEVGALDPKDRAQAGQVLGLLGDDRPGVGVKDGLPDIEWVEFPAGSFLMGDEEPPCGGRRHEVELSAFAVSRYPVTNAQFQVFIDDGGYGDRELWYDEGWAWKEEQSIEGPLVRDGVFDLPNHPRGRVSWYEAMAYCRWLGRHSEYEISLPTEAQWERAARGMDGRVFPWGNEFDPSHCNMAQTGIGSTSAVGLFPTGESPSGSGGYGILDGSGNVDEWCSDWYELSYPNENRENPRGPEQGTTRVIRGGSWNDVIRYVRASYHFGITPTNRYSSLGFRLARGRRHVDR